MRRAMARGGWWRYPAWWRVCFCGLLDYLSTRLPLCLTNCDPGWLSAALAVCCRLIDEMRSTIRCKADAVFVDVVYENPHSMDVNW